MMIYAVVRSKLIMKPHPTNPLNYVGYVDQHIEDVFDTEDDACARRDKYIKFNTDPNVYFQVMRGQYR